MEKTALRTLSPTIFLALCTALLSTQVHSAENGWLRGSCESGSGVSRWTDGDRYEGQCLNNSFQGQGTLTLKNGDRYEGQFQRDQKNGRGVYFFANGDRYEGQFMNGRQHG